jgi:hypothetical protein
MRYDKKIKNVIDKYGLEGYGLYCLILESIAEKLCNEKPEPDLEENCEEIAKFYKGDTAKINEMASYMVNEGLIEVNEISARIECHKIYKYLEQSQTRSDKIKNLIKSYKTNITNCLIPSETVRDCLSKKRTEKNRKEQKKYGSLSNVYLLVDEYNRLISEYDKAIIDRYIESLSTYLPNRKKAPYKNHNAVIRNWLNKDNVAKKQAIEVPENSKIDLNEEWI